MSINLLPKMPETKLPINRVLFFSVDLQRQFTLWIFHFVLFCIAASWIWDYYQYSQNLLEFTSAFWIRQGVIAVIIAHGFLIHHKYYSVVLLSISIIMNTAIYYLAFSREFFPTNYYIFLAVIPTAIVNIFYERRLSQWFLLGYLFNHCGGTGLGFWGGANLECFTDCYHFLDH